MDHLKDIAERDLKAKPPFRLRQIPPCDYAAHVDRIIMRGAKPKIKWWRVLGLAALVGAVIALYFVPAYVLALIALGGPVLMLLLVLNDRKWEATSYNDEHDLP